MKKISICIAMICSLLSFEVHAYETSSFKGKTYCFRDSTAKTDFDTYTLEINKIDQCLDILDGKVSENLSSAKLNGNRQVYSHAYYNLIKGLISAREAYDMDDLDLATHLAFSSHCYVKHYSEIKKFEYHRSDDSNLHSLSQVGKLDVNKLKTCEGLIESIRMKLNLQKSAYIKEIQHILKEQKCIQ